MKGFMCHSTAATAVCMASDSRSVLVPGRPPHRILSIDDHKRLISNPKYSRLVKSHSSRYVSPTNNRSIIVPSIKPNHQQEDQSKKQAVTTKPKPLHKLSALASSSSDQLFQVVVMRVSLHCQGCAGQVKKHLSKMEGVTSFSIELETKRVTVMGHVSPTGVLESISKVKKAEFWTC